MEKNSENNLHNINPHVAEWVKEWSEILQPAKVHWCDGSENEFQLLAQELLKKGVYKPVTGRPNSFHVLSDPSDVARVEDRTFICSLNSEDAGPTNNWKHPDEMKNELLKLYQGAMVGRTLFVIPFCMGPTDSPLAKFGVELTDSPYVVHSMKIMTRMGTDSLKKIQGNQFVRCIHSVGKPILKSEDDVAWPCNGEKFISHFPESSEIWSFGSGYGGNALLGKKCFSLRIASVLARHEGWLAEHMLILGLTPKVGPKIYVAAAFPSACGKTNLAMMIPTLEGYKVECVGDDIAWMKFNEKGELRAVNPESGFFGVAPGTGYHSNKAAMDTITKNSLFTNVGLDNNGDVWWEGMSEAPTTGTDWKNRPWKKGDKELMAHPNARFTAPASQCPSIDPLWNSPEGVPISAIILGGRRSTLMPLILEANSWEHGVFLGATMASEKTAAATGVIGELRRDPFAMLPFCGYHMADYFAHWLSFGEKKEYKLPRIFFVNWFRKNSSGKFLWPGFGENVRALKWISERLQNKVGAESSPLGLLPKKDEFDWSGLHLVEIEKEELFSFTKEELRIEAESIRAHFKTFGKKMPAVLSQLLSKLESNL